MQTEHDKTAEQTPDQASTDSAATPSADQGGSAHDAGPEAAPATPVEQAADMARGDAGLSAEVEAELDAAMADLTAATAGAAEGDHTDADPNAAAARKPAIRGPRKVEGGREHRTGIVVSVGPSDIFVEFGPKELGVLERQQYKDDELPKAGDTIEVVVVRYERGEGLFICAKPGAVQKADWEMLEAGQVVEARVVSVNKGGLACEVAGHDAFMPASQVDVGRINDLSIFVGEKFPCVVQRVDRRGRGNIVLSRREVIARERAEAATKLRDALKEGDVLEGTVRKIMPFGAFVDLGGIDGLIHLNDLSHERVNHGEKNVARHVSEGQAVKVQILKLDWDNDRISLGRKQLEADPFAAAASDVVEGAVMSGKVTKILEFGAFVEVAPGVEGLVHISELD